MWPRNRCLDELRRKRAIPFSHLEAAEGEEDPLAIMPDPAPLPEEIVEQQELRYQLHQAIHQLHQAIDSAVVLSRYTGQLSIAETAITLHMPEGTVKTYIQRARPLLRAALTSLRKREEIAL